MTGIMQAYVTNLNNLAKTNPQLGTSTIQDVLGNLNALNDDIKFAVRNNLGGHANHTMFWEIMGPNGGKPEGEVLAAIDKDLGGLEKFQTDFNAAGGRQFGSGWVFVTVTKDGKLAIETRPNQDSPIMDGKRALMGNDVWEHAYYLNYQNRRADYLKAWWNTVNWSKIAERYAAAKAGTLGFEFIFSRAAARAALSRLRERVEAIVRIEARIGFAARSACSRSPRANIQHSPSPPRPARQNPPCAARCGGRRGRCCGRAAGFPAAGISPARRAARRRRRSAESA